MIEVLSCATSAAVISQKHPPEWSHLCWGNYGFILTAYGCSEPGGRARRGGAGVLSDGGSQRPAALASWRRRSLAPPVRVVADGRCAAVRCAHRNDSNTRGVRVGNHAATPHAAAPREGRTGQAAPSSPALHRRLAGNACGARTREANDTIYISCDGVVSLPQGQGSGSGGKEISAP